MFRKLICHQIMVVLVGLPFYLQITRVVAVEDLPCSPRAGDPDQGQVCVCNSSYCDTLERPSRLPKGQFYRYSTSNSTPGFTRTTGSFSVNTIADNDDDDVILKINSSVTYQEILGFGGSFTDSTGIVIASLPEEAQNKLFESYFSQQGIEYTMARVPIAGTDFSTHYYSYEEDFPDDVDLHNFNITIEDYTLKIPMIQRAIKLSSRGFRLIGCSWFTPLWMKTKSEYVTGYLLSKYQQTWAKMHVKFLEAYKSQGLEFWAIGGGNELLLPLMISRWVGPMFGMLSFPASQRYWLRRHLLPALRDSSFADVKFLAMDDIRIFAPYWMKRMAADPETVKSVAGVALHWYLDYFDSPSVLDQLHRDFPDKLILFTESSVNDPTIFGGGPKSVELGSWERAEDYLYNIMENMDHWANAYIDWNLAVNTSGGPYLSLAVDASIIINKTSGEFYKQPIFYGMGHFSKFIPPNSRRIEVKSNQNSSFDPHHLPFNATHTRLSTTRPSLVPSVVRSIATDNPDGSRTLVVLNTLYPIRDVHQYGTRSRYNYRVEQHRTVAFERLPSQVGIRLINRLPEEIKILNEKKNQNSTKTPSGGKGIYSVEDFMMSRWEGI